jgi:phenylacetate-CoA ligase
LSLRTITYRTIFDVYFRTKGFHAPQIWKFLEKSQWWSHEEIQKFQDERLKMLIKYVYKYVPYYRKIMDERRLKPSDIQKTDDLIKFPVLTKESFRKNWRELVSDKANSLRTTIRKTGGSTGHPIRIINDYSNSAWENAAFRRGLGFAGYNLGEPIIKLTGGTLGAPESYLNRLKDRFSGVVFLSALEISHDTIYNYVMQIKKSKAKFLRGYPSAIYLMAKILDDANLKIPLKAVFPTAEMLYGYQRRSMKKIFEGDVHNQYGFNECNSIAIECEAHAGLHVSDEHVFLESLIDTDRVAEGEMGALTLTTFHNYATPFIRYQNGDIISLNRSAMCTCKRGLSRITKIHGRSNDLLLAKDGRLVTATFIPRFCVNADLRGIEQFQIIQENKDIIHVNIIKNLNSWKMI